MAKNIPDRWTAYKSCGSVIEGTSFICFKVPLRKAVQKHREEIWDIDTLLAKVPGLGAVIDLTNTARYYDPGDFETVGVRHKKILIPGREIPSESKVTEFRTAVDKFLKYNPGMIVGVHCTHGLNRTGYMVCRYMRDRLGIPAQDAIEKFETARGYHVERKNYIADLLGLKPPPPDKGPHTAVKPVKNKRKGFNRRFKLNLPGNQNSVYPDEEKSSVYDSNNEDSFNDVATIKTRKVHNSYTQQESTSRKGKKTVNRPPTGDNTNNAELSWRRRSPEDGADSDFHHIGQHRPRESACGSWRKSGSRQMYGRPSAQSSKYSFDYRYDY